MYLSKILIVIHNIYKNSFMEKKSKKCSFSGEESTTDSVEEEERKKRAKEKAQRQYFMQTKQNGY